MANDQQDSIEFSSFLEKTSTLNYEALQTPEGVHIAEEDELEKMRQHIFNTYEGIDVQHSYLDEVGQVWDCIPIEQQPSLRGSQAGVAMPPDLPLDRETKEPERDRLIKTHARPGQTDKLGNEMSCPSGTIPMRRVTLYEMARFRTLRDFFQKAPGGGQHPRLSGDKAGLQTHRYAHAYQSVWNMGGRGIISIAYPKVNTEASQIFSLSQHWYAGGSGSNLQTVECGWQVYPQKYKNFYPIYFIYWTPDNYQTGCYNLECAAFVQTNGLYHLGKPVPAWNEMTFGYYLHEGNWWLFGGKNPIGYYPISLFNNGQMAFNATEIDFGGETTGISTWPPMGTGVFANKGYTEAAYQRNICYYPAGSNILKTASLTADQPSPSCYTIDVFNNGWGEYFYYGGPGGTPCAVR